MTKWLPMRSIDRQPTPYKFFHSAEYPKNPYKAPQVVVSIAIKSGASMAEPGLNSEPQNIEVYFLIKLAAFQTSGWAEPLNPEPRTFEPQ